MDQELQKNFDRVNKNFEKINKRFDQVDKRFDHMDQRFVQVDKRFDAVDKRFDAVDKRFAQVDKRFDENNQRFDDLVEYLGENMATKDDIKDMATKTDLLALEKRLDGKIESATANLDSSLTQEIRAVSHETEQIRWELEKLEKRMREDSDAFVNELVEVVELKKRLAIVERKIKTLQPA